jgi:Fur family peroxide stress response transcriptional regulator
LNQSDIISTLKERGLKATHQRIVIYKELLQNHCHPCADELFERLKADNPSMSLATLYKTLDSLVEVGLVQRVLSREGVSRFDALTSSHVHIICTNTKEIIDFDDQELEHLIRNYLTRIKIDNFSIESISINVEGRKLDLSKTISIS